MSTTTLPLPGELHFRTPPPGLEPRVEFTLTAIEGAVGLFSLSATDGAMRLFVLDAATHLPHYTPRPAPSDVEPLGTEDPTVLVVVNPGAQSTVNLAAPILLNEETGACAQIILEGERWPLRAPLTPA